MRLASTPAQHSLRARPGATTKSGAYPPLRICLSAKADTATYKEREELEISEEKRDCAPSLAGAGAAAREDADPAPDERPAEGPGFLVFRPLADPPETHPIDPEIRTRLLLFIDRHASRSHRFRAKVEQYLDQAPTEWWFRAVKRACLRTGGAFRFAYVLEIVAGFLEAGRADSGPEDDHDEIKLAIAPRAATGPGRAPGRVRAADDPAGAWDDLAARIVAASKGEGHPAASWFGRWLHGYVRKCDRADWLRPGTEGAEDAYGEFWRTIARLAVSEEEAGAAGEAACGSAPRFRNEHPARFRDALGTLRRERHAAAEAARRRAERAAAAGEAARLERARAEWEAMPADARRAVEDRVLAADPNLRRLPKTLAARCLREVADDEADAENHAHTLSNLNIA